MARAKDTKKEQQPDFEEAISELEAIVSAMEDEDLPLEDLVERFETGTRLLSRCQSVLDSAKKRLQTIAKEAAQAEQTENPLTTEDSTDTETPHVDDDDIRLF